MSLPNLEPPYFVQYPIDHGTNFSVSATLGGLLSQRLRRVAARPKCSVRVGDYSFDNTNLRGSGFNFGARYDAGAASRWKTRYDILRRYLWLLTDSAYKSAVEAISRKRAALRNLTQSEKLNDFAHARAGEAHARALHAHDRRAATGAGRVRGRFGACSRAIPR